LNNKVLCFEPQSVIYNLLEKNIKQNNLSANIKSYNVCVGNENGYTKLSGYVSDGQSKGNKLIYNTTDLINYGGIQIGNNGEECPMIKLDNFKDIINLSFIKVDVEGAEPLVFYGAQELIKQYKPTILYEKNNKKLTLDNIDSKILNFDIKKYAISLGYKYLICLPKDNYLLIHPTRMIYSNNYKFLKEDNGLKIYSYIKPNYMEHNNFSNSLTK